MKILLRNNKKPNWSLNLEKFNGKSAEKYYFNVNISKKFNYMDTIK